VFGVWSLEFGVWSLEFGVGSFGEKFPLLEKRRGKIYIQNFLG